MTMIAAIASFVLLIFPVATPAARPFDDPPKAKIPAKDDPLAEARGATDREEWAEASEKFRAFLDANPKAPGAAEARFWAGFCQVKLGEHAQAVEMLKPFTDALADDKWADDALLQIGKALHGQGKDAEALAAWKRHLEKYKESVWRTEVTLDIIDVLFRGATDLAACLDYCERLTKEVVDRGPTTEARYIGAYCLNSLRRFDESEAWADRLFDPESPLEEAWRQVLGAQRELLRGRVESALGAVDALAEEFPDLDQDARRDLLLRTVYVLRFNGRADRARELLLAELLRSSGRPEDEVNSLLDELGVTFGDDRRGDFLAALGRLSRATATPVVVRVAARDRHAQALKEGDHADQAETLLRPAMTSEAAEFPKFRAAMKLAEILADDPRRRGAAAQILEDLLPRLKRRDLIRRVREAAEEHRKPVADGKDK